LQFDQQLVSYIFSVMTRDALLTSHPVSAEIRDPDDITLYFDAISYDKVCNGSDLCAIFIPLRNAA